MTIKKIKILVLPLLLLATIALSVVNQGEWAEAAPKEKSKTEKTHKAPKKLKNKKIEKKNFIIINAETPHAYKIWKKRPRGERNPDLSGSTFTGEEWNGSEGEKGVEYTVTLKNSGNANASDIDILIELGSKLGEPQNFTYRHCEKRYEKTIEGNLVEVSNLVVNQKKNCTIKFQIPIATPGMVTSFLSISPASEGGEEIGPIASNDLNIKGDNSDTNEDIPREKVVEETPEIQQTEEVITENPSEEPAPESASEDPEDQVAETPQESAEEPVTPVDEVVEGNVGNSES